MSAGASAPAIAAQRYATLDPNSITVLRDARQRRDIQSTDLESLRNSISRRGQLQPIVVTRDLVLRAGERRLQCCKDLGITVEVRFFDTLSPMEAEIVELEENLRREELHWRDFAQAVAKIHKLCMSNDNDWTQDKTSEEIGLDRTTITKLLRVADSIHLPILTNATGWKSAWEILSKIENRKLDNFLTDIAEAGPIVVTPSEFPITALAPEPKKQPDSILHANFLEWASSYTGQKFNFIHCDFPYGIDVFAGPQSNAGKQGEYEDTPEIYWTLLRTLCSNLDNLLAFSGHIMFWFSMHHYTDTIDFFTKHAPILEINPIPLVWLKSDNAGVCPDPLRRMRQITETALILTRGNRNMARVVSNAYAAPTDRRIHPSCKPEPMLYHFFSAFVDDTTRMLDPTCGSGSALRAAERHNAELVLGLEADETHVQNAKDTLRRFRALRSM